MRRESTKSYLCGAGFASNRGFAHPLDHPLVGDHGGGGDAFDVPFSAPVVVGRGGTEVVLLYRRLEAVLRQRGGKRGIGGLCAEVV